MVRGSTPVRTKVLGLRPPPLSQPSQYFARLLAHESATGGSDVMTRSGCCDAGEYAMLKFAAQAGALNERDSVLEALLSMRRAGADLILTYYALDAARWLSK